MTNLEQEPQISSAIEIIEQTFGEQPDEIREAYEIAEKQGIPLMIDSSTLEISQEQRDIFSQKHIEIYTPLAEEIAAKIASGEKLTNYIFESGMFGGKTSFVFLILETLEHKYGIKHITCINQCMEEYDEDYVTARSLDKVEHAEYYGSPERNEKILQIITDNNLKVVFLDECSFRFGEQLEQDRVFIEECNSLGATVILTGLNKDFRGLPLEFFTESNQKLLDSCFRYQCKAFVPGKDTEIPNGTHTTRYLLINDVLIPDLGVYPLVVSKEDKQPNGQPVTIYAATTEDYTMAAILRDHPQLLEALTSDKAILIQQEINKERIKTHP
jgi:thymidine kinase